MDDATTKFLIEDPGAESSGSKPRKQRTTKQEFPWRTVVDKFLDKVPIARSWRQKQIETGLHHIESYRLVVLNLVRFQVPSATQFLTAENCLTEVIKSYSMLEMSLPASLSIAVRHFRALILFSVCAVLETRGLSAEAIDTALKTCLTGSESWHLRRLRRAAVWTNHLVARLSRYGWNLARASELFFLCGQSIHTLGRLQHTQSSDYIVERLSQPIYTGSNFFDCLSFPCLIPDAVYWVTSVSGITLSEVYDILGYTDPDITAGILSGRDDLTWSLQLLSGSLDTRIKNLCEQAPEAVLLLLLFHALFGSSLFSEYLVEAGLQPRQRLRLDGHLESLDIAHIGLEDRLSILLTGPKREGNLTYLRTAGIIKRNAGLYQIAVNQEDLYLASIPSFWFREALKIGCYYFSGSALTPLFTAVGNTALPFFQELQGTFFAQSCFLSRELNDQVAQSLLNSSRFSDSLWKDQALKATTDLIKGSSDRLVRAETTNRFSILQRVTGHLDLSDGAIFNYFYQYWQAENVPSFVSRIASESVALRVMCGHLIISLAWNSFQRGQVSVASNYLSIIPANLGSLPACTAASCMTRKMNTLRGKMFFYTQEYTKAEDAFQLVFKTCENSNASRMEVLSNLGDLCCEMGRCDEAMRLITQAEECPEIYRSLWVRKFRKLRIVKADVILQQRQPQRAEQYLSELARYFDDNPNAADIQLNHVRVLVLLARKSHLTATSSSEWDEARARWSMAKGVWSKHHPTTSVDYAVLLLSISDAVWELEGLANQDLRDAETILANGKDRRCWIRGSGTDWFDWVTTRLYKKGWEGFSR